jgi:hypothetical protein
MRAIEALETIKAATLSRIQWGVAFSVTNQKQCV